MDTIIINYRDIKNLAIKQPESIRSEVIIIAAVTLVVVILIVVGISMGSSLQNCSGLIEKNIQFN